MSLITGPRSLSLTGRHSGTTCASDAETARGWYRREQMLRRVAPKDRLAEKKLSLRGDPGVSFYWMLITTFKRTTDLYNLKKQSIRVNELPTLGI